MTLDVESVVGGRVCEQKLLGMERLANNHHRRAANPADANE
jgi:hypothetical protein